MDRAVAEAIIDGDRDGAWIVRTFRQLDRNELARRRSGDLDEQPHTPFTDDGRLGAGWPQDSRRFAAALVNATAVAPERRVGSSRSGPGVAPAE